MIAAVVALLAAARVATLPWSPQIVSGSEQSAQAYASGNAETYVAEFAQDLTVRLRGRHPASVAVRFSCISAGCTFPKSDQPDEVSRPDDDPRSYDVKTSRDRAALHVTLGIPAPGRYVVLASPVVNGKARTAQGVRFILIVR
jgi:hypothetical protein